MALSDQLVGFWRLDDPANGTRADATSEANDLADVNSNVTLVNPGKIGNAAGFGGINQYLRRTFAAGVSDFAAGSGVSFSFVQWVRLTSKAADGFFLNKDSTPLREWASHYVLATDRFRFRIRNLAAANITLDATTFGSPNTATWYFLFCAYDSPTKTLSISVNDGAVDTTTTPSDVVDNSLALAVGARGDGASFLNGDVDAVGFWRRVLTSQERTDLYNAGAGIEYPFPFADPIDATVSSLNPAFSVSNLNPSFTVAKL